MTPWYEEFYEAVDAMDPVAVGTRCTEDTRVRMANHEPVVGRDAVLDVLRHFWSTISGMRHEMRLVMEDGDTTCMEAIVRYTRHDGSVVRIPAVTMIRREGDLVADQRIYIDMAPLHSEPA